MQVCGQCGVQWSPGAPGCDACGSSLRPLQRDLATDLRFVAVRVERECKACHRWSPIDRLGPGEPVRCVSCGQSAPLPEGAWRSLLQAGHAVADLVGPDPEGSSPSGFAVDRANPFVEQRGKRRCWVQFAPLAVEGMTGWLPPDLRAWMASGLPLSGEEQLVWAVSDDGSGDLRASVPGGEKRRYLVDTSVLDLHPPLVGVIADEHEVDRPEPDLVVAGTRPICGGCRAVFVLDGTEPRVRCGNCGLVSHVPAALRHDAQRVPRPDTWWWVFRGPSPYRRRLEGEGPSPHPDRERVVAPRVADRPDAQDLLVSWTATLVLPLGAVAMAAVLGAVFGG